jgi:hypothetical protein
MRPMLFALALATTLGSAASAGAQTQPPSTLETTVQPTHGSTGPTLWGILPWGGIGIGGRFMLPLGIQPVIKNSQVHDSFALEFGADVLHWSYGYLGAHDYGWTEVLPVVGGMWNIWLNEHFGGYPKLELGYAFGWFSNWDYAGARPTYGGFFWDVALGAMYKMDNGITLRAEAGYAGLKLGAGWLF